VAIGIESSADKLGVGIVTSEGEILANNVRTYKPGIGKGVIPRDAAQHHSDNVAELIKLGLNQSGITADQLDIICFTQGSGMGPCLRVDAVAARTLATKLNKPIVGVNHQVAHVEIGRLLGKMDDPVVLYVSGGNSQVIAFASGRYRIFGETLDIPLGNCLDVFGREMNLDNNKIPMGAVIEQHAKLSDDYIPLPYVVKGMDFSFSGILTAAVKLGKAGSELHTLCNSLQETTFGMVTEVAERALAHTGKDELLVTGGVAANNRLKEMLNDMVQIHGARFAGLPAATAIDNGAMIAWLGILMYQNGHRQSINDTLVRQHFRPEEVEVIWR
ncbi:MAG: bifunctional N(6)-L-threonylcarbamoyladenine synthase/serine/threonine protein kinase, partial [Candidatus Heimdallarchaeota archaeon]|nr:bifunctional N(6)-L-threonylcarbamoyladenine synthase/serine/threonine protein kinase [Candidatus Heimdallarchaeota archaeon]